MTESKPHKIGLLEAHEPPAASIINGTGRGPFVLVCEHASNKTPEALGTLGLGADELESHIAWDPGAASIAEKLSAALDAPLVLGGYSRLIYDCNRPPDSPAAIIVESAGVRIPANENLTEAQRAARTIEIYGSFRLTTRRALEQRAALGTPFAIATIHSFERDYPGGARTVEFGVLHDADARLADAVLSAARTRLPLKTERNSPYGPDDGVMHTLRVDAAPRGVPNVMLEIRNDLIRDETQIASMGDALAALLREAWEAISPLGDGRNTSAAEASA